jgi:hypothetical protein
MQHLLAWSRSIMLLLCRTMARPTALIQSSFSCIEQLHNLSTTTWFNDAGAMQAGE